MLAQLVGAVIACVSGAYFSREFAILARNLAEAYFGRPRLVRETSRVRAARLRDLASFVFGKIVKAPLAVVKDRARVAGEEGLLCVRIVVDRVGNGASIIGSWLRDEGTTLLDVCKFVWRFVKNAALALVELLGLIAFAVTARARARKAHCAAQGPGGGALGGFRPARATEWRRFI